jgi:beta-glucanase (GH16 family)
MLHIKPTLQDQSLIENDNVVNLLQDGICSSDIWSNCVAVTNTTNGTIINPVKSGRVSTRLSHSIKFGRIEVEAQLPEGDWMWPAIWMLPVNNTYGDWPASGEIDIMESRGNNYTYPLGGNNIVSSTLHWGPDPLNDAYWQNIGKNKALQTTYTKGFHTFGLEWSEKYLFTYVDSRLQQVTYTTFKKPFWQKGRFPSSDANGTRIVDPWSQTGRHSTPFDQDFYLILNVAVGGTNGWFEDGMQAKPWVDTSDTAPKDFWNARDQWYPTWQDKGQMIVKSVKMWQQKGFNGCE